MYAHAYFEALKSSLDKILHRNADKIRVAARRIADSLASGGVVHLFGSGHSHLPVEEAFYRAGGLAAVNPVLDPSLMFHEGVEKCIALEKWENYATRFIWPRYDFRPGEVMIIFSNSGRNCAPIEMAMLAKEAGLYTIGITSVQVSKHQPSLHSSGKHLCHVVDLVIDHDSPPGDTAITLSNDPLTGRTGGISTIAACAIINALWAEVAGEFVARGLEPPVLACPNHGDPQAILAHNREVLAPVRRRISAL